MSRAPYIFVRIFLERPSAGHTRPRGNRDDVISCIRWIRLLLQLVAIARWSGAWPELQWDTAVRTAVAAQAVQSAKTNSYNESITRALRHAVTASRIKPTRQLVHGVTETPLKSRHRKAW